MHTTWHVNSGNFQANTCSLCWTRPWFKPEGWMVVRTTRTGRSLRQGAIHLTWQTWRPSEYTYLGYSCTQIMRENPHSGLSLQILDTAKDWGDWLMFLFLLCKKQSSSFAGSFTCSHVDLSSRFLEFFARNEPATSGQAVPRFDQLS